MLFKDVGVLLYQGMRIAFIIFIFILSNKALAQSPSELIKRVSKEVADSYIQPLVTSVGTAVGGGLFHTAKSHSTLGFDIGIKIIAVPIPSSARTFEKTFDFYYPITGGSEIPITVTTDGKAQTILGEDKETKLKSVGQSPVTDGALPSLPGGINLPIPVVPIAFPQISLGVYKGTEILIRGIYLPKILKDDVIVAGGAIKWEFTNIIPGVSHFINASPQLSYQYLKIGNIGTGKTVAGNIHTSTDIIPIITPYFGLGYEYTSFVFIYEFSQDGKKQRVKISTNGENDFRATFGITLRLTFMRFNIDYNFGRFPSITSGISLSVR